MTDKGSQMSSLNGEEAISDDKNNEIMNNIVNINK